MEESDYGYKIIFLFYRSDEKQRKKEGKKKYFKEIFVKKYLQYLFSLVNARLQCKAGKYVIASSDL